MDRHLRGEVPTVSCEYFNEPIAMERTSGELLASRRLVLAMSLSVDILRQHA